MNIRCKICNRKLNPQLDTIVCGNNKCPIQPKTGKFEVLTFENYKTPKFTVIEDFECKDGGVAPVNNWNNWTEHMC